MILTRREHFEENKFEKFLTWQKQENKFERNRLRKIVSAPKARVYPLFWFSNRLIN